LLAANKAQFNAAMRSATSSKYPPGGSTKVNGQVADKSKQITANIAHEIPEVRFSDDNDNVHDDDDDDYDDTTAFLLSVLGEQSYDTAQATGLMIDDALFFSEPALSKTDPAAPVDRVPSDGRTPCLGEDAEQMNKDEPLPTKAAELRPTDTGMRLCSVEETTEK
jgi:hypothetical protein